MLSVEKWIKKMWQTVHKRIQFCLYKVKHLSATAMWMILGIMPLSEAKLRRTSTEAKLLVSQPHTGGGQNGHQSRERACGIETTFDQEQNIAAGQQDII